MDPFVKKPDPIAPELEVEARLAARSAYTVLG